MDFEIARFCNELGRGTIDGFTGLICEIWLLIVLWSVLVAAATIVDRRKGRHLFVAVLFALVLHFAISEGVLKHGLLQLVQLRVRPYLAHPAEIVPIGKRFVDSSFPSSHAASTAAVLTVFARFYRWSWPLGLAFVLLMAFSRMHDGMHYPTDVLAGSLLGLGYGLLAVHLERRWFPQGAKASAASPTSASD